MSFIEGEITVEFGGTVGPAGPAGNAVPIAAGTVLANPSGVLANPVGVDAAGMRDLIGAVGYVSQTLTDGEKQQARENVAAVGYVSQTLTVSQQVQARTNIGLAATAPALCVIAVGESNSGGVANNANAFAWELASRPELQMLNTTTLLFENLDIGTNNNLNHLGLTSATHGWELELANACKRNEIGRQTYYIQTGQGGTLGWQWIPGAGGYFETSFIPRVDAAKAQFATRPVQYVVWLSLGINDAIASTNSYLFKGHVRRLIAGIKAQIPDVKICIGRIMRTNASYEAIDDRIAELSDDPAVRIVSIASLATDGGNHWNYYGMRGMSERMLDATRQMVSTIPSRLLTFVSSTASIDGSRVQFSAINQYANASETIDFSFDQSIEIDWLFDMNGLIVILDTDIIEEMWAGASDPWLLAVFENGQFFISETNGATTGTPFASATVSRLRFRKFGNDLLLESTVDNSTWTTRHTRSGVLSGVNYVRIKMKSAIGGSAVRVFLLRP
jgi:hypothetical protein